MTNTDQLGSANSEVIIQVTNRLTQNELEKNYIIHDKRNELLIVLSLKDSTPELLQRQGTFDLSPKSDAVPNLNATEDKEKLLENEKNLLNSIASLTHNLSRTMTELLVLRRQGLNTTAQIEIELQHKADELNSVKSEKTHLEHKVVAITEQLHKTIDEQEKSLDKLNKLKQANLGLIRKVVELKRTITKYKHVVTSIQGELSTKDAQLTNLKNKENKLRLIATKYKNLYLKLKMKEDKTELAAIALEEQAAPYTVGRSARLDAAEAERVYVKKLEEVNRKTIRSDQSSKSQLEANVKECTKHETQKKEAHSISVSQLHRRFEQHISKPSTNPRTIHDNRSCETTLQNNRAADVRRWSTNDHKRHHIEVLSTGVEKLFSSGTTSQNKRTRMSKERFQPATNIGHITYKGPTSSQYNEGGNVATGKNKDDDERLFENKETEQRDLIAGVSNHTSGKMFQIIVSQAKNEPNTFEDSGASTALIDGDENVRIRIKAEESYEANTSSQMKNRSKYMCGGPLTVEVRDQQNSSHPTPHRRVQKIGEIVRRPRKRL